MSNNIDIKTLEAFQDGNHKAFETVFIAYYNKTKTFIDGYIKSESDAEELTEDLFVNLGSIMIQLMHPSLLVLICIQLPVIRP